MSPETTHKRGCPKCGSRSYRRLPLSNLAVRFTNDRQCTDCRSVYAVAVPTWAAVFFALVGAAFTLATISSLAGGTAEGGKMLAGLVLGLGCLAIGVGKLAHPDRGQNHLLIDGDDIPDDDRS